MKLSNNFLIILYSMMIMVLIKPLQMLLLIFLCFGIIRAEVLLLHKSAAPFALFGNISSFDDIFLPDDVDDSEPNITKNELRYLLDNSVRIENTEDYFTIKNMTKSTALRDEKDFNDINLKMFTNTRKRLYGGVFFKIMHNSKYDQDDEKPTWNLEMKKIKMLQNFAIDFLLHSRKKIEGAFGQREKVREDKRYKLGYLFNRLRRLKTEMKKIVYQAQALENGTYKVSELRLLDGMMRDYERVVRMDVDIRDTCDLIRKEYNVKAPYDIQDDRRDKSYGRDKTN